MTVLDDALAYRERGWSVIPVRGKKPLFQWSEFMGRCATESEIRSWYAHSPDTGVAVITGTISGLTVVDWEVTALPVLPADLAAPSSGPRVRSGRGGLHVYCRHMPGLGCRAINVGGEHLGDIRSDGGFVVAPPSPGYSWLADGKPGPVPDSILALVPPRYERRFGALDREPEEPVDLALDEMDRCEPRLTRLRSGDGKDLGYPSRSEAIWHYIRICVGMGLGDRAIRNSLRGSPLESKIAERGEEYFEKIARSARLLIPSGHEVRLRVFAHRTQPNGTLMLSCSDDYGRTYRMRARPGSAMTRALGRACGGLPDVGSRFVGILDRQDRFVVRVVAPSSEGE